MCYHEWEREYEALEETSQAITLDDMPHSHNPVNMLENVAIRRAELAEKMKVVEDTAEEADPELSKYILKGVTDDDAKYENLNIPCSRNTYYDRRRKFYYLLNKKI